MHNIIHSSFYVEKMYLASADWLTRNLDRSVEVVYPIYEAAILKELKQLIVN